MGKPREVDSSKIRIRKLPTSRVYVHDRCGTETRVSHGHFKQICGPFIPCTGTFCCGCNEFFPLNEVYWKNTGERIDDYRERLRRKSPALVQVWRYGVGFLIGAVIGAGIGA